VARILGKDTEWYSTYGNLHYAKATDAGYYSPDLVQTFETGWSTENEKKSFTVPLDFAIGFGRSREHDETFGPWGLSLRVECDLSWKIRRGQELRASYEYDYNQFNPAVQDSSARAWSMIAVKVFYRWAREPVAVKTQHGHNE